jgi:hypothetical protein
MASAHLEITVLAVLNVEIRQHPLVEYAISRVESLCLEVAALLGGAQLTMTPLMTRVLLPLSFLCLHALILLALCVPRNTVAYGPVHIATMRHPLALVMGARTHHLNAGIRGAIP